MEPNLDHQQDDPAGDGLTASPRHPVASPDVAGPFLAHRPMLFGLAYRLLGTAWDAEDVIQDAYLRWAGADRSAVREPRRYLSRTVGRLALDRLRQRNAEPYAGPWLPEPVVADPAVLGPLDTVEQRDSVSIATLHLLERLNPPERAVYVLRTAFDVPYDEIAEIIERSPEHCRQLYHRASERIGGTARFSTDRERHAQLLHRFMAAAQAGDLAGLAELLRADVVAWTDGGGKANAARKPVHGRDRVARAFTRWYGPMWPLEITMLELGGLPALTFRRGGIRRILAVAIEDGQIARVYVILNPDKLRSFG
ncbi:RNA polymerase sigma factor SigJ [Rugosimonospora africana]|uniref:RNA polymerase sigma24 factor n=1 Tax=Rugosimonospora africana TaxID=556532 RepID=A0A8J3VUU1_9ACTN|nr:RNA polymerase sigma factor SigJ [Rugosimonospora africana]GIH19947.1 RNA polymerase sigma24 factor [Rugosimonospora africana]